MKVRLFFATDVHGSEVCWRKFINSGKHYEADVLVLGGDMTGKAIIPIVDQGGGKWKYDLQDVHYELQGEDEVAAAERAVRDHGYYPRRMTPDEVRDLSEHPEKLDDLFRDEMRNSIQRWVDFADERLAGTGIQCIVCPGNDDTDDIDEVLATSQLIKVGEGNIIDMPEGYQLMSSGWTNLTPWDTPREEDEPALKQRILQVVEQATAPPEKLVFGLHAPPYDTQLDVAPKINWDSLTVKGQDVAHVGSSAVKEVIEEVQPLLSLHGHIHESRAAIRIGRTLAINPGSSYVEGTLSGVVVELDGKSKLKRYRLTMG